MPRLGLGLGLNRGGIIPFAPLALNPILAYEAEFSMLATGGGAAAQGDGIATLDDLTVNSIDAIQTTATQQPIAYDAANGGPFARFDGASDRMTFTLASNITNGTLFFATKKGSYAANLTLDAGTHNFSGNKISDFYLFGNDLVALYLFDRALTDSQISQLKSYFVTKGAVEDYGGNADFRFAWQGCTSLTSFPLIDTSSGNRFDRCWRDCTGLTSFPLIDTSLGANFSNSWQGCTGLTSFPSIDASSGNNFGFSWYFCTSLQNFPEGFFDNWNPSSIASGVFNRTWDSCILTAQSVENILTSIDRSGKWATTNGASGGTALADAGIDIDYNGDPLSAATTTAISNLQGKGWVINISP